MILLSDAKLHKKSGVRLGVATITMLDNYYNFSILDIVSWNLNDQNEQ